MTGNNSINSDLNCNNNNIETVSANQFSNASVNVGLNSYSNNTQPSLREKGGLMGWVFGIEYFIFVRHVALTLCVVLALVVSCGKPDIEALKCIVPVFTLSLGYIFGKEDKSSK